MAHKKAGGSTNNGRDSNPNMHGVKKFGGQAVIPGNIIVRQSGSKFPRWTRCKNGERLHSLRNDRRESTVLLFQQKKKIVSVISA